MRAGGGGVRQRTIAFQSGALLGFYRESRKMPGDSVSVGVDDLESMTRRSVEGVGLERAWGEA